MIERGESWPLGATCRDDGVNFALFSADADDVVLCFFDRQGNETRTYSMPGRSNGVWHGFVPGCASGQQYGYRVHGRYEPSAGLRFNPNKLLVDPYARQLSGALRWSSALFGYAPGRPEYDEKLDDRDSAPFVPKGVVLAPSGERPGNHRIPWKESVIYETNVRGYTMRHPDVPEADRGTFRGMRNGEVLKYLKALGVTSIELMPVHAFVDEHFLFEKGLRNYWGYNTLSFFAPEPRYLGAGDPDDFRDMTRAIHDAGLEVILDVVYNHTAEGNRFGPTLSFRGIDNKSYYRLSPVDPRYYINDTGTGNTLNIEHPRVLQLVMDSLRYWSAEMGVDGYRFDLAPVLGRQASGFNPNATFFATVAQDPVLSRTKLIAEPWDVGPGGYQLGSFPPPWVEWNDRYRDTTRRFWRGDGGVLPEFARRLHGSSDIFEGGRRPPWVSMNFVASHDGFTTADAVTYEQKHNEANGEDNRDGHNANYTRNYGVEGPTQDFEIQTLRRRQRLNMLATVLLSQGTPMLLAGDEFGHSQGGNNNAYAQDNETSWLNWSGVDADPAFQRQIARLIELRKSIWLLRQRTYVHGMLRGVGGFSNIAWLGDDGEPLPDRHWDDARHLTMFMSRTDQHSNHADDFDAVAIMFNAEIHTQTLALPKFGRLGTWQCEFYSGDEPLDDKPTGKWELEARTLALFVWRRGDGLTARPQPN